MRDFVGYDMNGLSLEYSDMAIIKGVSDDDYNEYHCRVVGRYESSDESVPEKFIGYAIKVIVTSGPMKGELIAALDSQLMKIDETSMFESTWGYVESETGWSPEIVEI